ncbi:cadmium-translocating P-type ATPase [Alkaliphilus pronyensis]|uniref:Cadmium-translocating P-type ATPase n=1 Tax=Alkaliphilus pronyensis TaxID=1482732 RepID=A0A6I0F8M7_9FIRM|nr:heavy metal translocating P-type ATPase [Alkaliphilus pronyensis]KAB3534864.1 cadmium-translocating P-type ATPase [Alkaliphilus pronyensis]
MGKVIKKEFVLEGLDCANCASKIEARVKELDGVANANMNFITKTLSIEITNTDEINKILQQTQEAINNLEPHVVISEKTISKLKKKTLLLMGLSCGNCAAKIERELSKLSGVKNAAVNFTAKRLLIEAYSESELEEAVREAAKIIKAIEPEVNIVDEGNGSKDKSFSLKEKTNIKEESTLIIGAVIFAITLIFKLPTSIEIALYTLSYLLVGGRVLLKAGNNILRGQIFDENFLMAIATFGAFAIKEYPEAVAVMLFYRVGEFFQSMAVNKSRRSIESLMDIRPDYANLKTEAGTKTISPQEVQVGDIIIVKPGEKLPLDGEVVEGNSMLDTSALTGESVPRDVGVGSRVLSGSINLNGLLTIEVTKSFRESTVSKILDLVENATTRKAPTENFITKFARYYTPVVVGIAVVISIIPPILVNGATFTEWIYRALIFLVISCPCALVVSIPLGFFGGIGGASRAGVLVKGGNYLEALNNVETIVFDKTGTLTKGVFEVTAIETVAEIDKASLLEYAAYAEGYSNHPIALSIKRAYKKEIDNSLIENYREVAGYGVKATVKGMRVIAGNSKLMKQANIILPSSKATGTVVHIAINEKYMGYLLIADEIKDDSIKAIKALKDMKIKRIAMLTGDSKAVADKVANQLGLDEVYAELLPHQKVDKLELLDKRNTGKGKLVFVGDGINDAPVLARADIGIAMGGIGSDAAIEAADVVIMTDEPSKVSTGIKIARRTRKIVWQNIVFALGVKFIFLLLGATGIASMWEAVFADVGVTIIAVFNAMRAMNIKDV